MGLSYGKHIMCITQLPDDPLCPIYQKLNNVSDRKSFSRTCHRFLEIVILNSKYFDGYSPSNKLRKLYNRDAIFLDKSLNIFCRFHSPSLLSVVNLSYCAITDNGLKTLTKYCKSITTISLLCCHRITNNGIWFLSRNCPQLRALKITGCDKVVGVRSQSISPTLAYLKADSHVLYPTGFLSGGGLQYLEVTYSDKHCMNTHERGLAAIGSGIAKYIKIIDFSKCSFVTDDCMMKISIGCPTLQELNLSYCHNIGLPSWESIGLRCKNMERLHVNYYANLCDRGLLALGNGCKSLSVLYMTMCVGVTTSAKNIFKIQRRDVKIEERFGITNFPSWIEI
ncbi:F-box/LRR-repeat protein 12-like [Rutidosis leptorrhynchoides]|uniref:F-box/LRR-repeat protein 12-like n=1 Tax=Rutidosis leptorrhynchoides TaxID=125765 RepID=UPI003A98FD94